LKFYVGKNDFWSRELFRPLPIGSVNLLIPALKDAAYHMEQDLFKAEVRGQFTKGNLTVNVRSYTPAGDNFLLTELSCSGDKPIKVTVALITNEAKFPTEFLSDHEPVICPVEAGITDGYIWTKRYGEPDKTKGYSAVIATRCIGADPKIETDGKSQSTATFELQPGKTVVIASAVVCNPDTKDGDTLACAVDKVKELNSDKLKALGDEHLMWWKKYWSASFIEIDEKRVESYWYGAQYMLACCHRPGKVAPGLWGNWFPVDDMEWHGSYTMDYNFQAPYYGIYSSNHPEIAEPYYEECMKIMPLGRETAKVMGYKGLLFPYVIGPYTHETYKAIREEHVDQMKWIGTYLAVNFIRHYQYTLDMNFLKQKAYPFLIGLADFWDEFLQQDESGRYNIRGSSCHEGGGENVNSFCDIAFLIPLYKALLEFSQDLGIDAERHAKWQDILKNLSPIATKLINGKKVFCMSDDEPNTMGTSEGCVNGEGFPLLYPVWPGGYISTDSDPDLYQTALNTLEEVQSWRGYNGFPLIYNQAVRLGYSATLYIMSHLLEQDMTANLYVHQGGGGIEIAGATMAINEMLLQSHQGYLHFFPVWPKNFDARFGNLRTHNAFLVSSELSWGKVKSVEITSEKGKDCTLLSPWYGKELEVIDLATNKQVPVSRKGEKHTFKTVPDNRYKVQCKTD
ncbi:MAG: glycoside hydrolase family 95-like protein, partial [bacterium]